MKLENETRVKMKKFAISKNVIARHIFLYTNGYQIDVNYEYLYFWNV